MCPEFQTTRFRLRPIVPEDQPFIFEGLSHPQVIPHYGVQYKTLDETSAQMQYYSRLWNEKTGAWWKVVDVWTFEKVGAIGFNNYTALHRKCEIGYWLLPQHWGKGVIAEVLPAVLQYLYQVRNVHRVEALIEPENKASRNVVEKAGFSCEGLLRDFEKKEEQFISLYLYSLLATDKQPK